jgi:hypothetical protein
VAQKARALINLPEPQHAKALALLFNPGPFCLLPAGGFGGSSSSSMLATAASTAGLNNGGGSSGNFGSSATSVLAASGAMVSTSNGSSPGGSSSGAIAGGVLTLNDLFRFYLAYSESSVWDQICAVWQTAVDAICRLMAQQEAVGDDQSMASSNGEGGSSRGNGAAAALVGSSSSSSSSTGTAAAAAAASVVSFDFRALMCHRVAGLMRKPVRLSFGLNRLQLGLDVEAGLAAAAAYFERAAREFSENAKG